MIPIFIPLGRVTDRTRTVTDWTCSRERFYLTEYGGTGFVKASSKTELDYGLDMHDALAELAQRVGEADVVGDLARRLALRVRERETATLGIGRAQQLAAIAEGSFRGYAATVWPSILQLYDIVAVEQEVTLTIADGLTFMARPDLILRAKADGSYWYWEYKTTGQRTEDFLKQWPKAVQVHSAIVATESTLGLKITGCIIQGLSKGYKAKDKDGADTFRSPFCEGWRYLNGSPITYSYTYMRNKGWERFATWDHPEGVAGWVHEMPPDLLADQYPRTAPIMLRRDLSDRFFAQLVMREHRIKKAGDYIGMLAKQAELDPDKESVVDDAIQKIMDETFPMTFSQCTGRYGKYDCPMLEACWNPRVNADPLGSGLYVPRTPHHDLEIQLFKERDRA